MNEQPEIVFQWQLFFYKFAKNLFDMNAYAEKIEIIQWIAGLDDKATLRQLRKIKEQSDIKLQELNDLIT